MVYEPNISFIIVNCNGLENLKQCIKSLYEINYPKDKIEIILVDNGSTDNTVEYINKYYSDVKIIKNKVNDGFAKPNNDAAKIAKGEYIALINNDMKLDIEWLNNILSSLIICNDKSYVCVASKILNWEGTKLDFAGGSLSFYGNGYQFDHGMNIEEANEKYNKDKDILFACGGAMLINREIFLEVGGFDEDYFAYYEDVDLGWRLWILGYKIRFCSQAICYHKQNGSAKILTSNKINELFDRNSLFTIYKNYGEDKVYNVTTSSLLLEIFNRNKNVDKTDGNPENLAINEFLSGLPKMKEKRNFIQNNRKRLDEEIIENFFAEPYKKLVFNCDNKSYNETIINISDSLNINKFFGKPKYNLLVISSDIVGIKMAGPGIRYFEIAKQLCTICNVTLAIPNKTDMNIGEYEFKFLEFDYENPISLIDAFKETDIVLIQGNILKQIEDLNNLCKTKIIIVDLYDPFTIENLEVHKHKDINYREEINETNLEIINNQLSIGDYFICATEQQKNLWIGMLSLLNRINPKEYDLSPNLDKLIGLVPFGVNNSKPIHTRDVLKDKISNMQTNDKILIWGGGVWNWFDPLTLINAISNISKIRNDIKLFFMGVKHPNSNIPEMQMLTKAVELAEELKIKDKYVFFNMGWVDYEDRQNYLLESKVGISCHFNNLETRFSFRTRILDYLWAELPIICTEGDFFADEIKKNKLGLIVKYKDPEDLSNAIIKICDDDVFYFECKNNIGRYREKLMWDVVTEPLKDYCTKPLKRKISYPPSNFITDINNQSNKELISPIYDGNVIGQSFTCRYPNMCSIEILIGTFMRKNNHYLKFNLYYKEKNTEIYSEKINAANLIDNSWMKFSFKPIINSEAKEFYFTIQSEGATRGNCITLFKNSQEKRYGSILLNGIFVNGCISFRTRCIISEYPLEETNGIKLTNTFDPVKEVKKTNFKSNEDVEKLIHRLLENEIVTTERNKIKSDELKETITKLTNDLYEINNWKKTIELKIKSIRNFGFVKKIFK